MITKVEIQNFKSHKNSVFEFANGLNVIIGPSDKGKSAALRAIDWVLNNRPSGNSYRSWWGGDTSVVVHTTDGYVKRVKGKSGDSYFVKKLGKKEIELKAFGTNVPEKVKSFLNLSELNIQRQINSFFLLNETPGTVAKHFNKIANIEKIDVAISNVNKKITQTNSIIKTRTKDLEAKNEELKQYDVLPELEKKLAEAEQIEKSKMETTLQINELNKLTTAISGINTQLTKFSIVSAEDMVDGCLSLINKKDNLHIKERSIDHLIANIQTIEHEIDTLQQILTLEGKVNNVLEKQEAKRKVEKQKEELNDILYHLKMVKVRQNKYEKRLTELEEIFHKEMPDVCPLCNTKLK